MTFSEDDISDCNVQPYNPEEMTVQAREYKYCFDTYSIEFKNYEIYVVENSMKLAIGIVAPRSEGKLVKLVWLKYHGNEPSSDPLSETVILATKDHLMSLAKRFGY